MTCTEFTGHRNRQGYGVETHEGKQHLAHRVAYVKDRGLSISDIAGLCVCHTCDNPPCVNPEHLWLGTSAENTADKVTKGRCRNGVSKGATNGNAKFSDEEIQQVFILREQGLTHRQIARALGMSRGYVSKIINHQFR